MPGGFCAVKALHAGKDALESWDFKTMRRKERPRP